MLKEEIKKQHIRYFKERNIVLKDAYEGVLTRIMTEEKSGKYDSELTDEVIQNIIIKYIKEMKEAQGFYKETESKYADYSAMIMELEQYLPKELTEEEVLKIIAEVKASGETNKGKIIGMVIKKIGNRFDKSKISKLV